MARQRHSYLWFRQFSSGVVLLTILLNVCHLRAVASESRDHVVERTFSTTLKYRCIVTLPSEYKADGQRSWPMVLFLHGGGSPELERLKRSIRTLTDLPAIVVAPICPPSPDGPRYTNWNWKMLGEVVREISSTYRVDAKKRAVIGFSMGGSGAWELPSHEPTLFSKSVVIAGVCHPWSLRHYPQIPVWVFVGAKDYMRKEQQETTTSAQRFGVDVVETVWDGADHGGIFRKAMSHERMLNWLVKDEDLRQENARADDALKGGVGGGNDTELRQRFGEQQFAPKGGFLLKAGRQLPNLVWDQPELVANLVDDLAIPTRWFNDSFEEVAAADKPGRYYAYGQAPAPSGPPLRRAMTCVCVDLGVDLMALAKERIGSIQSGTVVESGQIKAMVLRWQSTEAGAVELAAILDSDQPSRVVREGQWQMENATQHVRLKRKLMGLDNKPIVKATVRPAKGKPAAELRITPLGHAGIAAEQVWEIESKLDEWYANSQEPMAVVIARNGVIVVAKGYGNVHEQSVTIDTPMLLHSAMKPLIGLQLAMYIDQGFIKLDEPIGNFLPDFSSPDDRNLTFRAGHVHTTGIHFPWELAFRRLFYFHTWHESLIAHCKREWAPGAKHRYGVVGVILSVRALELLRGRNYWDAMERDLFEPRWESATCYLGERGSQQKVWRGSVSFWPTAECTGISRSSPTTLTQQSFQHLWGPGSPL